MHIIDWLILTATLLFIVVYGVLKTRNTSSLSGYFKGDSQLKWWQVGISVMATQASAVTFISVPGQAYDDGMRFVQFYLGLPLAMIFICVFILPIYYRLSIYTAYEYLEHRFGIKTRILAALLFLVQRGLAAGLTIYAPSIILSSVLGIPLQFTNILIGVLVIIYTVSGGAKAVAVTQRQQMAIMMGGMILVLGFLLYKITAFISVGEAFKTAGALGKLNFIDWKFNWESRYNVWSGLIGGFFLSLSYFGTDQSQVARYLGGKSLKESRLGLLFNGILKIPMQVLILLTGVMVFVFYLFVQPPLFFNKQAYFQTKNSDKKEQVLALEQTYQKVFEEKRSIAYSLAKDYESAELKLSFKELTIQEDALRNEIKDLAEQVDPGTAREDNDYVFLSFITDYLPIGFVGILFAVILCAAMSSISSEISALSSTVMMDFYKRLFAQKQTEKHYVIISKLFTALWGVVAIIFAAVFSLFDNLIEAINIIGSLFYGTILGIFMVGFFTKKIQENAVFIAALIAEMVVIGLYLADKYHYIHLPYLWLNLIGCALVYVIAWLIQTIFDKNKNH